MSATRARSFGVAALLLGAAIACGDSTSPDKRVVPRNLDKVSGDEQSVVRGHTIDLPLTVRVVGSDGKPLAGATVQWSLLSGQARLPAKETTTNASGEAQALVSEIATIGQLFVSATVADVAPVVFSITGLDPCYFNYAPHLNVGSTMSGMFAPLDCVPAGSWIHDLYLFTLPSQSAVQMRVRTTNFDPAVELYPFTGWYYRQSDTVNASRDARLTAILPAGTYGLVATTPEANVWGEYEIGISSVPESVESCGFVLTLVGITTVQNLSTTDCATPEHTNEDTFAVVLWSGEEMTVTQSSSAFAPRLRITRGDDALAEGGGTGGTATIDYAADRFDVYVIHASSGTAGEAGQYTLSTAYKSPTMLTIRRLPSLNSVFPGEARNIGR